MIWSAGTRFSGDTAARTPDIYFIFLRITNSSYTAVRTIWLLLIYGFYCEKAIVIKMQLLNTGTTTTALAATPALAASAPATPLVDLCQQRLTHLLALRCNQDDSVWDVPNRRDAEMDCTCKD